MRSFSALVTTEILQQECNVSGYNRSLHQLIIYNDELEGKAKTKMKRNETGQCHKSDFNETYSSLVLCELIPKCLIKVEQTPQHIMSEVWQKNDINGDTSIEVQRLV